MIRVMMLCFGEKRVWLAMNVCFIFGEKKRGAIMGEVMGRGARRVREVPQIQAPKGNVTEHPRS